ncbi:uncharacterized protein PFL1_02757 [Pseudozyma flocculosa PF-1]|uniref:Uncharacterized protein n=1 Tax=Pseudozyma flocculosa PF-1 TaxID=1277687 RepID=A0A061HAB9_9BASI|nr:uncharacterized protein PFL1_02757 [Pseudozyma flocculosa PF-1]EPQ29538.1 hypothetical protein PFL1_02757 [Pseudozyma flocculosa PF-1]
MAIPPFLQKWLFLNLLRILTLVSCILVMASTILILKHNFQHLDDDAAAAGSRSTSSVASFPSEQPGDYQSHTDIPTQTWGTLWSTLHHVYNLVALFLVILSEVSWGGWLDRFFDAVLPFLGREWGTQMMGALLILLGADSLSRKIGTFALIANWLLVSVGLVNILSGIAFHSRGKLLRSPLGFKQPVAEKLEKLAEAKAKAEKIKDILLPLPAVSPGASGPPPPTSTPANASTETVVAAATKKVGGLWKKYQDRRGDRGEWDPEKAVVDEAGPATAAAAPAATTTTTRADLPAAVPFRPGMPPPPPPAFLGGQTGPVAMAQQHSTSAVTLVAPTTSDTAAGGVSSGTTSSGDTESRPLARAGSHHRLHSTDFYIVNAPRTHSTISSCSSSSLYTNSNSVPAERPQHLEIPPSSSTAALMAIEERSPGVLAKFRAAELEAKLKAKRRAEKKSLYLGSQRWLEESRRIDAAGAGAGAGWTSEGTAAESEAGGLPPYRLASRDARKKAKQRMRLEPDADAGGSERDEVSLSDRVAAETRRSRRSRRRRRAAEAETDTSRRVGRASPSRSTSPSHHFAPRRGAGDDDDDEEQEEYLVTPTPLGQARRHDGRRKRCQVRRAKDSLDLDTDATTDDDGDRRARGKKGSTATPAPTVSRSDDEVARSAVSLGRRRRPRAPALGEGGYQSEGLAASSRRALHSAAEDEDEGEGEGEAEAGSSRTRRRRVRRSVSMREGGGKRAYGFV